MIPTNPQMQLPTRHIVQEVVTTTTVIDPIYLKTRGRACIVSDLAKIYQGAILMTTQMGLQSKVEQLDLQLMSFLEVINR